MTIRRVERMREGLEVFGRYVSKDLVTQIMRSPTATGLGGTRRDLTVMFTDIEGFSRISESIEPELLTSRLSRCFEALGDASTLKPMLAGPNGDNPLIIGPAGTIHLSILDFATWAGWNAGQGRRGPALVKPDTLRKLHSKVIDVTRPGAPPG